MPLLKPALIAILPFAFRSLPLAGILIAAAALPVAASTLTFDDLQTLPAVSSYDSLAAANGGNRSVGGVTFDGTDVAQWEVAGRLYTATSPGNVFAHTRSGDFALAGNAYAGEDFFGTVYTGLTLGTSQTLSGLWVGRDDLGDGAYDADSLTITALGAVGDLGSVTTALADSSLIWLDTAAAFNGLSGIVGYRFTTTAADLLNAGYGRAYVIADNLTFSGTVPEPGALPLTLLSLALLATGQARWRRARSTKVRTTSAKSIHPAANESLQP